MKQSPDEIAVENEYNYYKPIQKKHEEITKGYYLLNKNLVT